MIGLGLGACAGGGGVGVGSTGGLDMDFTAQRYALSGPYARAFPSGWSFARASAGLAQRVDGSWVSFASDEPRVTDRGLLVEEARTNLFLNSAAPATQSVALTVGTYTLTVWGSSGSVTSSAGTATGSGYGAAAASVAGTAQVLTITGNGTVTFTVSGTPLYVNVEAGAYGTSPIVTAGASVTREADVASVSALSALMTPPCTVIASADLFNLDAVARVLVELNEGTGTGNRTNMQRNASNAAAVIASSGGAAQTVALSVAGKTGARTLSMGLRLQATTYNAVADGVMGTETAWTPPVGLAKISFGTTGFAGGIMRGYVKRARIFPRALTDAEMQALTA